ncbi:ribose-5-phosphate isomerase [Candidatus Kaiserbacteria bacterium CG10_big_fil_rev_8_21_14_0_10_56_12]|uniref:Ribose-5-phosphate isomerase n=1 Tax=Candidatus Kaiserbacteria bacterium CG10_big_fil_rev_8_21_14_0_10_56_12 TaxID=1974611 RepID=A0A2H0UAM4_9BACT|nr:MAG: ribose-5-phosphate isomerase [Candidatus Kaiserbacteria bacterium CG10_big_fil_rev_8_21_14_0_10_56_12]
MAKVYIAADHAGFALKEALIAHVRTRGYEVEDLGAHHLEATDDYPDFMTPLAERVAAEPDARGILVGGSGQGEAMCANRVRGVRAAVFYGPREVTVALDIDGGHSEDGYDAVRLPRRHNDANVLSLGARFISGEEADTAVRIFLDTPFSGAERHRRRLAKF